MAWVSCRWQSNGGSTATGQFDSTNPFQNRPFKQLCDIMTASAKAKAREMNKNMLNLDDIIPDNIDLSKVNIYHLVPKYQQMFYFWDWLKDEQLGVGDSSSSLENMAERSERKVP